MLLDPIDHTEHDIRGGAHVQHDSAVREQSHERLFLDGTNAVLDAVCAEHLQGATHRLGSGQLASMRNS